MINKALDENGTQQILNSVYDDVNVLSNSIMCRTSKTLEADGWYRFFCLGLTVIPKTLLVNISRDWNYTQPEIYTFFFTKISLANDFKLIGSFVYNSLIPKIRVVQAKSLTEGVYSLPSYLDLYYNSSSPNRCAVSILKMTEPHGTNDTKIFGVVDLIPAEIPDGYEATEFDLSIHLRNP